MPKYSSLNEIEWKEYKENGQKSPGDSGLGILSEPSIVLTAESFVRCWL